MGSDFTVKFNEYMPLRDLVFTTLRQAILKGELEPGERLMEIQLADKMGVSRTPIREAIRKLEKEGLVIMIPRRGAEVAGISKKMLKDVLEVRLTLEELAFKLAIEHDDGTLTDRLTAQQKSFEEGVRRGDILEMAENDENFHFMIYEAAGNDKLRELLYNLRENMYRYRMEYLKDENAHRQLIAEHAEMIRCIREKDVETGLKLVRQHIENQETAVLNKIELEGTPVRKG